MRQRHGAQAEELTGAGQGVEAAGGGVRAQGREVPGPGGRHDGETAVTSRTGWPPS
jgi:hypothetical protein